MVPVKMRLNDEQMGEPSARSKSVLGNGARSERHPLKGKCGIERWSPRVRHGSKIGFINQWYQLPVWLDFKIWPEHYQTITKTSLKIETIIFQTKS